MSILFTSDKSQLTIARTKRGDEPGHVSISLQSSEALHGFEDARRHPPKHHLSAAPALDVALNVPRATEQTLRRVGGRQRAPQPDGQIEGEHGEGFLQAFTDALGGAGMLGVQPTREILQQSLRDPEIGALIRAPQDRLGPGALPISEMVENVAGLVHLMPTSA